MHAVSSAPPSMLAFYETALRHAVNAIALCQAVHNQDGTVIDFRFLLTNPRYDTFINKPTDTVRGQLVSELFPGQSASGIWQWAADVVYTQQPYQQEIHCTAESGQSHWFDLTISHWENEGVIISLTEVSDQKARLLAQQKQAELLQQIVSNSLNGILVLESIRNASHQLVDFRIILANPAAATLNSKASPQLKGASFLETYPASRQVTFSGPRAQQQSIFDQYVAVVNSGEPLVYDLYYPHDGIDGWFWGSARKLGDGLILTFLDISDLKLTQQELEQTIHKLKQTNHNLNQFAYVASHDLQEPLRKITALGGFLNERLSQDTDETVRDVVARMQKSAQRMQELVKDLLTYSRLTAQPKGFDRVPLSSVLQKALKDLQPLIDKTDAVINVELLPAVSGDALQLQQLFFCLLSNALKFHKTGQSPRIIISAELIASDSVPTALQKSQQPFVAVSIEDTGIGFNEKYLDRIFTIFQQLHSRNQYDGTGIGLAIARRVAENHGGTLTARSEPGKGSVFTAWLPVY
ncbi:sensor histidine kinase [Spirosoma sp. KUDC1026]|uniref:sensor histidine kinase n=1 Tax=Spirosoma sp. KUDC1026 TaxID=2745947 RepID=UPI00159BC346|nr:ATP-binding protein [Spirosoma sp. KUDC1026]QKZ12312.1 PAS domain-containing protein [Spirosoma sp. KUDC1026]